MVISESAVWRTRFFWENKTQSVERSFGVMIVMRTMTIMIIDHDNDDDDVLAMIVVLIIIPWLFLQISAATDEGLLMEDWAINMEVKLHH